MGKQYWADAATQNCVWMFQIKRTEYGEDGCNCGYWNHEEACANENIRECTCGFDYWYTEAIYLTKEEALTHGDARPYAWGTREEGGWRVFGVPAKGIMTELLGQHNEEFEDKVEYITKYPKTFTHKVQACRDSYFNGIMCLESDTQYGFFKDSNDMRPSSCTWIDADKVEHLFKLFVLQKDGE